MAKRKNKSLVAMGLLMAVCISCSYVAGTYAKYTSTLTNKEGTATVAKWAFEDDNEEVTLDIDLSGTYDSSTLVSNRIAPGTEGKFAVELSNENSEVGVDYTISFTTVTGKPTNLKFYKDSEFEEELTLPSDTITGQIAVGGTDTVDVYWQWPYETTDGDAADTTNGEAGGESGTELALNMTITGVQTDPTTSITTP